MTHPLRHTIWVLYPLCFLWSLTESMEALVGFNIIVSLMCQKHYGDTSLTDADAVCQVPEVQQGVAAYYAVGGLLCVVIALYSLNVWCRKSDVYGRKPMMILGFLSTFVGNAIILPTWILRGDVNFMLLASVVSIMGGGMLLVDAMSRAYLTDCTDIDERQRPFSLRSFFMVAGGALGSSLASLMVWKFRTNIAVYGAILPLQFTMLVIVLLMPESTTLESRIKAREASDAEKTTLKTALLEVDITRPIRELLAMVDASIPRAKTNFVLIMIVRILSSVTYEGAGRGSKMYSQLKFAWTAIEMGYLATATKLYLALMYYWVLPTLMAYWKKRGVTVSAGLTYGEQQAAVVSSVFGVLGPLGFMLCRTAPEFIVAKLVETTSVLSAPALDSAWLNYIPSDKVGRAIGGERITNMIMTIVLIFVSDLSFAALVTIDVKYYFMIMILLGVFVMAAACMLKVAPSKEATDAEEEPLLNDPPAVYSAAE